MGYETRHNHSLYNEEITLPLVLSSIPKKIYGIDSIHVIVIDDGSTNNTISVARAHGVQTIVTHTRNQGLAKSFGDGVEAALKMGADIIVNTDADNQYPQRDIDRLIAPILEGHADIVVGDRQVKKIKHFSFVKRILQWLGSAMIRKFSGTTTADAVSDFRAMTRESAMRLNLFTDYTYTIESIIQAGKKKLRVESVAIRTNGTARPSRLVKSIASYLKKSASTIVRVVAVYEPLKTFMIVGAIIAFRGMIAITRFIGLSLIGQATGHIQSLIIESIFTFVGFQICVAGLVADLIGINRRLEEDVLFRIKSMQYGLIPISHGKAKRSSERISSRLLHQLSLKSGRRSILHVSAN